MPETYIAKGEEYKMSISRTLKKTINDIPKCIGDLIEFTKVEKWEISKINLLEQKQTIEKDIKVKQSQLDEIDNLLLMFESEIKIGSGV